MINTISPQEAARWLANGEAILIDVREADEFRAEHIAYANSLPLSVLKDLFRQMNIPVTRKIIFHCLKGARGGQACMTIQGDGPCDNPLYNMDGGITAWKESGLPVVSSAVSAGMTIFRQVQIIIGGLIAAFVVCGLLGLTFGFMIAGLLGFALFIAGLTGWCGLAMLLSKMPWNK
jgi:rhodanese-related sulfurtransferase